MVTKRWSGSDPAGFCVAVRKFVCRVADCTQQLGCLVIAQSLSKLTKRLGDTAPPQHPGLTVVPLRIGSLHTRIPTITT